MPSEVIGEESEKAGHCLGPVHQEVKYAGYRSGRQSDGETQIDDIDLKLQLGSRPKGWRNFTPRTDGSNPSLSHGQSHDHVASA